MWKKPNIRMHSLKSKLLVAVSALVIGSGLLISLLVTQRYSSSVNQSMAAQAENLAHAIALDAADKILTNDLVALQKMLDYHKHSNPNIAYLFFIRDDQVLAHTFMKGIPADLITANKPLQNNSKNFKKIASKSGEHYLDIAFPVFSGKAGFLRAGLSEKPYKEKVTNLWIQISFISFCILLLALTISLLLIRHVTRPLSQLAKAAESIDAGHLEQKVVINERDEVGRLASSFNRMVGRIKKYTWQLEEKNIALDRAHQQTRTSFVISQEINALSNLNEVCTFLIQKLNGIVTCKNMTVLVFSSNNTLFVQSEHQTETLGEEPAQAAYKFLKGLDKMAFVQKEQISSQILPEAFLPAKKLAAFPLHHENRLLGAMLIACPGECNCISKELDVIDIILNQSSGAIRRAAAHEEEIRQLKTRIEQTSGFSGLIGKDPKMQVIYKLIEDVAPTDATVLIQGESGTGKELVAQAIHKQSLRRNHPFVVINCSAYPATLLESELFGHEQGAFTGAIRQKAGRFEQADGGTVFLDEIGEIAPSAQIKLLRVLQSQKFERLGGEKSITVNVRVLAATNKDLIREVKKGSFREDLFYRLNVIPIHLPPLRDRRNDIPLLARHFLKHFAAEQNKLVQRIHSEAMRLLLDYSWPGNVRELENSIEHATVIAKGRYIEVSELPSAMQKTPGKTPGDSKRTILENERKLLQEVLEECDWNKKKAALRLGISRSTLYDKLKKYQIKQPTIH